MRRLVLCLALIGCSEGGAEVPDVNAAPQGGAPVRAEPSATNSARSTEGAPPSAAPARTATAATATTATTARDPDPGIGTDARPGPAPEPGARLPDATSGAGRQRVFGPAPPPVREWVEIVLRSTPSGATVSVDGAIVGITPTFWRGAKIPAAREFRFDLERHQTADFTFVPIKSGVLHPSLVPTRDKADAPASP